jgi:sarcosine/dimethylglycine N-methyltransferase
MSVEIRSAFDFYERHPISAEVTLAKLNASRGHLNDIAPEESFPHDQDHHRGLEANDAMGQIRPPRRY